MTWKVTRLFSSKELYERRTLRLAWAEGLRTLADSIAPSLADEVQRRPQHRPLRWELSGWRAGQGMTRKGS